MSNQHSPVVLEICVDSVDGALAAQQGGAQRIARCENLVEGGTTPSSGTIALARQQVTIGLNVIIRPRGGDFLYSDLEFAAMQHDLSHAKALGADGVVIGLLNRDGTVDRARTAALIALARPLSVTFHRAFDMARDPATALETLIDLGIDRVLTSGQEQTAIAGIASIVALKQQAGDRIIVMPGGGVTEENVGQIVDRSGVREIHFSARSSVESQMSYRNERIYMGLPDRPEFQRKVTDVERIRAIKNNLRATEHR